MTEYDPATGVASNRQLWDDPTTAEFWRYWQYNWDSMVRAATDLLLREAGITPGLQVLDLGSGHGEPALALAFAVGPKGHVTATDVSASMLALAEEQAAIAGLANLTFTVADAAELPYPDATFDIATSRFGIMYFADAPQACQEIRRVLAPGGRFACAVWGPADAVPWYAGAVKALSSFVDLPPLDLSAPGPFRFSTPGGLTATLTAGGFANVHETTHDIQLEWPDGLASFVTFVEALHCGLIAQVPATHHDQVHDALCRIFRSQDGSDAVRLPARIIVASGYT